MFKQHREIAVHLFECGQQAFTAFFVQARDTAAQCPDRLGQICLFANQSVVFRLNLFRVFLGTQVYSTQGFALSLQTAQLVFKNLDI